MIPKRQSQLSLAAVLLLAGAAAGTAGRTAAQSQADASATRPAAGAWMYIGTYTGKKPGRVESKGIYRMRFGADGSLGTPELVCTIGNPSFLAMRPGGKLFYAVCEGNAGAGKPGNCVAALSRDADTGALTLLNQQPSGGSDPCYVSLDSAGKTAFVANYSSGSTAAFPIADDGRVGTVTSFIQHTGSGPDPKRQTGPHAHCIDLDPTNRYALSCDLGLDKVLIYKFDAKTGKLSDNDPPAGTVAPGAGPRHLTFHPSGKFVYVINEMGSTVTTFSWDVDRGALAALQTVSIVPRDFQGLRWGGEIQVHPSGKFLYASDRGDDIIASFSIDPHNGELTEIGHVSVNGKTPRHFAIDPSGKFLIVANQDSDNLVVFSIDQTTGALTPTGTTAAVGAPVCVVFVP